MNFVPEGMEENDTDLELTPMIDVVFQLLIFFLVGTKFRVPEGELEAYLPHKGGASGRAEIPDDLREIRITLLVSEAGSRAEPLVRVDDTRPGVEIEGGRMAWLEQRISLLAQDRETRENVPIIIEVEPHLAYKWVIRTLNICRRAGFTEVSFAASKRNAPPPTGPLRRG